MANKTGVIYLKIRVRLAMDVSEEDAREFVEECDYKITSPSKKVVIEDTEIVDWGETNDCNGMIEMD